MDVKSFQGAKKESNHKADVSLRKSVFTIYYINTVLWCIFIPSQLWCPKRFSRKLEIYNTERQGQVFYETLAPISGLFSFLNIKIGASNVKNGGEDELLQVLFLKLLFSTNTISRNLVPTSAASAIQTLCQTNIKYETKNLLLR